MPIKSRNCKFKGPGGIFHFRDWGGSGPLTHFSHATGLCAGAYTPLAQRLRPHLKMIGMDDRGHGKTQAAANPAKLKDWNAFVDDLACFFEHLAQPVIAVGHYRGATVSLLLAVKRPELIRALVLIDPTILPFSWMWWWYLAKKSGAAKWVPIVATAARRRNVWPDRRSILNAYCKKAVFGSWQKEFLEAHVNAGTKKTADSQIMLRCAPDWESRCFAVCPHDVWCRIPTIQQPTLLLYGAKSDTFLSSTAKRFKAKAPLVRMVNLEQTGHFVPMDRPDDTAAVIINFLKDQALI